MLSCFHQSGSVAYVGLLEITTTANMLHLWPNPKYVKISCRIIYFEMLVTSHIFSTIIDELFFSLHRKIRRRPMFCEMRTKLG